MNRQRGDEGVTELGSVGTQSYLRQSDRTAIRDKKTRRPWPQNETIMEKGRKASGKTTPGKDKAQDPD